MKKNLGVFSLIAVVLSLILRSAYICTCLIFPEDPIWKRLSMSGYNEKTSLAFLVGLVLVVLGWFGFKKQTKISKILLAINSVILILIVYGAITSV